MSAASDLAGNRPSDDADRNLALLAYGLLFVAIFFAGLPALIEFAKGAPHVRVGKPLGGKLAARRCFSFRKLPGRKLPSCYNMRSGA